MNSAVEQIHSWFKAHGKTLCCAESLTSGGLQAAIGSQSGASKFFRGGATAYDIAIKAKLLGVDAVHAKECDAVSQTVAQQMAKGACTLFGADYGIATTGYAEPYPEAGVTVPHAYFAVYRHEDDTFIAEGRIDGADVNGRMRMQQHVTQAVLEKLAQALPRL